MVDQNVMLEALADLHEALGSIAMAEHLRSQIKVTP